MVEGSDLRALEPALSKDVSAALLIRGDHWVNNQRLVTAYALAAAARGVTVRAGVEVGRMQTCFDGIGGVRDADLGAPITSEAGDELSGGGREALVVGEGRRVTE